MRTSSPVALALTAAVAVVGCDFGSVEPKHRRERPPAAGTPGTEASPSLMDALRRGGHVLLFRHAATDFSMADETRDPRDLRDCTRQRNLNAEGRRQSRSIGTSLARLGVPVGEVIASPYCRTRHTARLAFGRVRSSTALLSGRYLAGRSARDRQPARLRRLLAASPRRGTNTVLVSHAFAIDDATGVDLAEGEAAVVAPWQRVPRLRGACHRRGGRVGVARPPFVASAGRAARVPALRGRRTARRGAGA